MHNKTFRLFISSTFSDFKGEREILQVEVFPELETYCTAHGFQFQAIDLRWGVNEEAQIDQKTIEICLNEVNTCKHYPHPNFLIMLGDRYGWIPLPYAIEKKEFENILSYYSGNNTAQKLLQDWYQHDENHLFTKHSTAYVINPRTGKFVDYENWEEVENQLRKILQKGVANIDSISDKQKYYISATEQEVYKGIYPYRKYSHIECESVKENNTDYKLDMEYVYGFIRTINPAGHKTSKSIYFDSNKERLHKFRFNLKKTLVKGNLLVLQTNMVSKQRIEDNYLDIFRHKVLNYLKSSIDKQIKRIESSSDVQKVKREHFTFKQERLKIFIGRHEILERIKQYITDSSSVPLIISATSGMGKTSLMAKAIDNVDNKRKNNLIYRFVGVSERSSNIRGLLISIIRQIDIEKAEELDRTFDDDNFNSTVKKVLIEVKNETVIFIDALDQLQEKSYLKWLPNKLPPNLKLIISVLDDERYSHDSGYLDLLKVKYNEEQNPDNFIQLNSLNRRDGDKILSKLLNSVNRTITLGQRKFILDKFEKSGYSPLYLIITFEEIKNWKSFESNFDKKLEDNVINSIKTFLNDLSTVYHHQKLLVSRTLGYLECAKNGLSEKEMIDILSSDRDVMDMIENQFHNNLSNKIPIAPWARLFSQLSPFLIQKMSDDVSLIILFHRQFRNAIQTETLNDISLQKRLHLNLAHYFKQQPLVSSEGVYNLRKLSEYAFQLFHSNSVDESIKLFEQDYIRIKYETKKFYDCLLEIEQAFSLITKSGDEEYNYKHRLFISLLKFLDLYSIKRKKVFNFDLIHTYFIYRMHSKFYPEFLEHVSKKEYIKEHFTNNEFVDDYHLRFLSGSVGFLRRTDRLKEATTFVKQLIEEYSRKLEITKDPDSINKHLSSSYYELGYINYLRGNFKNANSAFKKSVDFAQNAKNETSEWITKCVMTRIAYLGGLIPIEEFDTTLDQALIVFKKLESNNIHAKRWIKVTYDHKFEVANIMEDQKVMRKYYNLLHTNQWNKERNVAMEFHQGQLALVEKKYRMAIDYINKYLKKIQNERVIKEESIARVYYYLGLAYFKNGNIDQAKLTWNKTMSLNDEPGNHAFKKMTKEKLAFILN